MFDDRRRKYDYYSADSIIFCFTFSDTQFKCCFYSSLLFHKCFFKMYKFKFKKNVIYNKMSKMTLIANSKQSSLHCCPDLADSQCYYEQYSWSMNRS